METIWNGFAIRNNQNIHYPYCVEQFESFSQFTPHFVSTIFVKAVRIHTNTVTRQIRKPVPIMGSKTVEEFRAYHFRSFTLYLSMISKKTRFVK